MVNSPQLSMRVASLWTFLYVVACLALTSHSFGQDTMPFATVRVIVRDSKTNLLNGARVTGLGPEKRTDTSGTVTYTGVGFGGKPSLSTIQVRSSELPFPRSNRAVSSR